MMTLSIQIKTLLFSLCFGFIFGLIVTLTNKLIYNKNSFIQIFTSFVLAIASSIIYFIILQKLNEAIIHPYYLLVFVLGFIIETITKKYVLKIIDKFK